MISRRILIPYTRIHINTQAYIHAITSTRPKVQYRVGIDAKGIFPFLQVRRRNWLILV